MLYGAIDIHKHAFQAAVLDPDSGEVVEERFSADRESFAHWADGWRGQVVAVAIEATTGWRWVWRELIARGFEVRLAEPLQARALLGRRRSTTVAQSGYPRWSKEDWKFDSPWIDIYVFETVEDDWRVVLDFVGSRGWPTSYTVSRGSYTNPQAESMPSDIGEMFETSEGEG